MSDRKRDALACLVATCAHLTINSDSGGNRDTWKEVIADVLPDCDGCPEPVLALVGCARAFVDATTDRERSTALTRLHLETRSYYQIAAAKRFEIWQLSCQQERSE